MRTNSSLLKGAILTATLLLPAAIARAQEEHIYLIKMFDCTHQPTQRSQTGFRVRGSKGIVTALHGVADCGRFTASSREGLFLDQPLKIARVDIDRDVAILSSSQLDSPGGGLEPASKVSWKSLGTVRAYGHPYGIGSLETTLSLRNPPLKPLKDLIPPGPLAALMERRSPNHLINVLNLQGNLLPGHSGAPILDAKGRVVAVANGGLKEGFAGISWAILFQDIEWVDVDGRLKTLGQKDPNIVFANDIAVAAWANEANTAFCESIYRLIMEARTGFISIVGNPTHDKSTAFKPKIVLPGSFLSFVYPNQYVGYSMYKSEKINWIESQYYNLGARLSGCLPAWKREEKLTDPPNSRRTHIFSENDKSPRVEIYYYLEPHPKNYTLRLSVYVPSEIRTNRLK